MPVFVSSILLGVWGLNIITRMIAPHFPGLNLKGKYFALQLVLMTNKLQPILGNVIITNVQMPCSYPLTTMLYKNGK